jgi:hypothetical protein
VWGWQEFSGGERQAEFIVVRPPGQLHPTQVGAAILLGQRRQEGRPLPSRGQAELAHGRHGERLVLPDHRLVDFGVMGVRRLEMSSFSDLLPPQCGRRLHGGGDLLAQRLPALGRLLEVASAQPLPVGAYLGMERHWSVTGASLERHQVSPEASGFLPQRLTLSEQSRSEAGQWEETHNARGGRLLVGHASAAFRLAQRILARTDVCQWAGGD